MIADAAKRLGGVQKSTRGSSAGHAGRGSIVATAGAALLFAVAFAAVVRPAVAEAEVVNNVVVVEDDGTILEAPDPLPFVGSRVVFSPAGTGYTTRVEPGVVPAALGARLETPEGGGSVRVRLVRPVPVFGRLRRELFIHPDGAISFGAPLPDWAVAADSSAADSLGGLLAGPPVIAVLWNELRSAEANDPGAGLYIAELPDRVVVTWAKLPSVRPAGSPNTFRAVLHRTGRIELEYAKVATAWGVVGMSPGDARAGTDIVDLATEPDVLPDRAVLSWYSDRPRLNEVALARRVYAEAPDRFDFLAVFTDQVVEAPHLVGSVTVANRVRGIGMPLFDHARVFGSRTLEHVVMMNSLSFYDPDPKKPPKIPEHAFSPSTLAVLGHEMGHRWLAHAGSPLVEDGDRGHWSFFLETDGSLMGGSRLVDNADGTFTTTDVMSRFGPLDQYLMGVRPPEEVGDFFVVEHPWGVDRDEGSAPVAGVTFGGERRNVSMQDMIARLGTRSPQADAGRVFRMGFVLVVSHGATPAAPDLRKLQRIRREFGPYFRAATGDRARVRTWVPRGAPVTRFPDAPVLPRNPFILGAGLQSTEDGMRIANVDFLDLGADLRELELWTDASADLPPARIDLAAATFGSRRGTVSFALRHLPAGATEIHLALVDSSGLRSETFALPLTGSTSET